MTAPTPVLEPFVRQKTVLLTTYRRDGTPVGTPVNIAVDGDRAFVRTFDTAWKLKRIRNNPVVVWIIVAYNLWERPEIRPSCTTLQPR
jgi:PPOX class probable F420-dependent enzyme